MHYIWFFFAQDVFDFFTKENKLDYSFYKIMPDNLVRVEYIEDLENFQYCNYLIANNRLNS